MVPRGAVAADGRLVQPWLVTFIIPSYPADVLLPGAERAFIDLRKLADHVLGPTHSIGQHKARVFAGALGLARADVGVLHGWLIQSIAVCEAVPGQRDEFGQRYTVDFPVSTDAGSAVLRSAWIVRPKENFPRLVTCFVLPD